MVPLISVIIATRNRRALLAETLRALARQDWPWEHFEIVVADNGSSDGTRALIEQASEECPAARMRYVFVARPGKSHAVNKAFEIAHGEIFALTDDDVRPEPEWLRALARAIAEPGVDFVAGRILPIWEAPPPRWMSPALYGVLAVPDNGIRRLRIDGIESGVMPIGANMAVRRRVVEQIGTFHGDFGKLDGSLRTGEDHEFFLRMLAAGLRGLYEPAALVHHFVPMDRLRRGYFRRWLYQNGRDVARLRTVYPESGRHLLQVPGYLWRQTLGDARTMLTSSAAGRFAAAGRLGWMLGYLRESWFPGIGPRPSIAG